MVLRLLMVVLMWTLLGLAVAWIWSVVGSVREWAWGARLGLLGKGAGPGLGLGLMSGMLCREGVRLWRCWRGCLLLPKSRERQSV